MVAPGICHVKARLVDLIGSSGIENATSAQPKNLASAPRLSPLRFFGGVAGDETMSYPPAPWAKLALDLRNGGVALYLENFSRLELLGSVP